jgi:hypothetical protein
LAIICSTYARQSSKNAAMTKMDRSQNAMAPLFNPELTNLFGGIRDLVINWLAIAAVGSRVSRKCLSRTEPLNLGCVFVPWFTYDGAPVCHLKDRPQYPGQHVRFPQKGDSVVTLDQATKREFRHPWMSEERIKSHEPKGAVQLLLPAYDVERGYLLLDGAHRSIATLRAGVEYDVQLAVIHGPIDRRVLRDLAVFERPS